MTTLKDSGPGSLRAAIDTAGRRIVVFEVGGTIALEQNLVISNPHITIAGQTAPPPGVTLRGGGLLVRSHDVLVQHLRIRVGDEPPGPLPHNRDAITLNGPSAHHVVLDHISASWAIDENVSTWNGAHDITISNSIISEGLHRSRHPKGPHSKGVLVGDGSYNICLLGNLLAHNYDRNPRLKGSVSAVVMNNVIYNGKNQLVIGSESGPSSASVVNNIFIPGPDSSGDFRPIRVVTSGNRLYLSGNLPPEVFFPDKAPSSTTTTIPPIWHASLRIRDSASVRASVLATAGARPRQRDDVDKRIIREVRTGKGRIPDSQRETGGWPELYASHHPFIVPESPNADPDRDGYTNIEDLLHRLAWALEEGRDRKINQPLATKSGEP